MLLDSNFLAKSDVAPLAKHVKKGELPPPLPQKHPPQPIILFFTAPILLHLRNFETRVDESAHRSPWNMTLSTIFHPVPWLTWETVNNVHRFTHPEFGVIVDRNLTPSSDIVKEVQTTENHKPFFMEYRVIIPTESTADGRTGAVVNLVEEKFGKYFGYLARCEFWVKLGLRFWILVG